MLKLCRWLLFVFLLFPAGGNAEADELIFQNTTQELGPGFGDPWNKYAWSMQDYGGYMYVGTNNVHIDVMGAITSGDLDGIDIDPANPFTIFPALQSHTQSRGAEIWRYEYATETWSQDFGIEVGDGFSAWYPNLNFGSWMAQAGFKQTFQAILKVGASGIMASETWKSAMT